MLARRADGYHDIETLMVPIPLNDILEVIPSSDDSVVFTSSGLTVDSKPEENLCVHVWRAMRARYGIPGVRIHLHKKIPVGAGLGGGSADAAFTVRMLNELFSLGLTTEELEENALHAGSDCPFFIRTRIALATGRGEVLTPLEVQISGLRLVVVKPSFKVSTAMAYQHVKPNSQRTPLKKLLALPVSHWKDTVFNDFEEMVLDQFPEAAHIKQVFYEKGALYAQMSGSGSAFFALFEGEFKPAPSFEKRVIYNGLL